jgi:glycosyltransferase involved in cell wall biosynthesis
MRICLVTGSQPSNNPRLVKEADALVEAGYTVHAIGADCGLWPSLMDADLMKNRLWTFEYAAGNARRGSGLLRRARHKLAKQAWDRLMVGSLLRWAALSPVTPELERAAVRFAADLYIAHHPVALPAVSRAANKFGGKIGYDAEDLHTGMWAYSHGPGPSDLLVEQIERQHVACCDYVTTAAPGFSAAYAQKYGIPEPPTVLNVFPVSERPLFFRPSDPAHPLRLYWFSQCIGENRGLEDVVRSLGLLRTLNIQLHLRGNWQAGYKEKLFTLASSVGLDRSQITVHPPAAPAEMVRLASEYDIGLALEQPVDENRSLCLSNKLFVYILAGNAIAATGSRGQRQIAESLEDAAFSYEPGHVEGLATGIRRWHTDRQALNAARDRAWRWGTERYNWDLEKRKFLAVVDSALRGAKPARELAGK